MNMAKSKEVKEQFDTVQVSLNSVNNSLNNVQNSTSVIRGYVRESLIKLANVEDKMVEHIGSTSRQINELVQKMNQLSISKAEKLVPYSFLHKASFRI